MSTIPSHLIFKEDIALYKFWNELHQRLAIRARTACVLLLSLAGILIGCTLLSEIAAYYKASIVMAGIITSIALLFVVVLKKDFLTK